MNDLAIDRRSTFNAELVRQDFPILQQDVHGKPLVYLDNAATTQKPEAVIQAIVDYYRKDNSNVHRGAHALAERATDKFEQARVKVAGLINAAEPRQIIWTRGTSEGINLVAASWGRSQLREGDRILVSAMEHHSNIVPWQMIAAQMGATVEPSPVSNDGTLDLDALQGMRAQVQGPGLRQPGGTECAYGPFGGRVVPDRGRSGHEPSAGGRAGAGLRFLFLFRAHVVRPSRRRRALRQGRAAGSHAAKPG